VALFPNPPAWAANTAYLAGIHEVTAGSLIYLCTRSGTSAGSAPSWPTTFNASVTDGTAAWTLVQRARGIWAASTAYTSGVPVTVTGTTSTTSTTITSVSQTTFIPIGATVVGAGIPTGTVVTSVGSTSFVVSNTPTANGSGVTLVLGVVPYPWPDQVVEESTLGLWQCVVSGTSGGSAPSWTVSPNWPPNEPPNQYPQPYVTDGGVTWALVAYDDE
jgi:hypothetical protein